MDNSLPKHIAIMLDGNRRWLARRKQELGVVEHEFGANNLRVLPDSFLKQQEVLTPFLTIWGSSIDNLTKRSKEETDSIINIYRKYFQELSQREELKTKSIKVNFFGRWRELLPNDLVKILIEINEKTKENSGPTLTFLLAYSGKDEMLEAIRKIRIIDSEIEISEKLLKENLWTGWLPPVDLVIRTGVENDPHWSSGFMMWSCADSQFYFTETLWPDFSVKEFDK